MSTKKILVGVMMTVLGTVTAGSAFGADAASYIVPAGEGMPDPVTVKLKRARLVERGDGIVLDYRLPKELDGAEPQRFKLTGVKGGDVLLLNDADGKVTATCTDAVTELTCIMTYTAGIELNDAAADLFLSASNLDANRVAELQAARGVLEHQAVGIVRIRR